MITREEMLNALIEIADGGNWCYIDGDLTPIESDWDPREIAQSAIPSMAKTFGNRLVSQIDDSPATVTDITAGVITLCFPDGSVLEFTPPQETKCPSSPSDKSTPNSSGASTTSSSSRSNSKS